MSRPKVDSTTYDALNRVTQVIQTLPNGHAVTIGYGYDANGNRTSMSTPWGSFAYLYDQLNRLTRITNPQSRQFNFQYDANGRRTQLDYPNGVRTTYGHDNAGQVLSIIHTRTSDSTVVAKSTYSYDSAGNRLTMVDLAGMHAYGYDDLHRLTSAAHPTTSALDTKSETFSYDSLGNRLADAQVTAYTYDDANRLVENSSFTYTYDADGNRTGQTDKLTSGTTGFIFNSENQLMGAARPNGENWTYKYDRPGRRVEKSSGTATSQKQRFVYDGDNILAIVDGANSPIEVFTMGLGIDEALSLRKADGTERYLHADAPGSVGAISNVSGIRIESYEYFGYGRTVAKNSGGAPIELANRESPLLYTGKPFDDEIGLQNNNNRQLDEQAGIFSSADPVGIAGGLNLYAYVRNRPTLFTDPSGTTYKSNAQFLTQWVLGLGARARFYGPNSMESQEMSRSPAADVMRQRFCARGNKSTQGLRYGTFEAYYDTMASSSRDFSSTSLQVGGFAGAYAINNGDGTATYIVRNEAGANSFFYHALPNQPFASGPMRTITQVFMWTEPIK